jgi:sodium/bile acid cotransporter 7
MNRLVTIARTQWFLLGLAILIPLGFFLGRVTASAGGEGGAASRSLEELLGAAMKVIVFQILLLMSWTLDTRKLVGALRTPAPVIWAALVNAVLMPLLTWPLCLGQMTRDFSVGLMIAGSVPCTMAAASVWTRRAGGNDAVSLLVTVLTNGLAVIVTPFWMSVAVGSKVSLSRPQLMTMLFFSALLPIVVGQSLRLFRRLAEFADRRKVFLSNIAQSCILATVFWSAYNAGPQLKAGADTPAAGAVILVWLSTIAIHVAGLVMGYWGGRALRLAPADTVAAAFAGSQKTLPIGILVAESVRSGLPFAVFPMLMFHASQLVVDTIVADRFIRTDPLDRPQS